MIAEASPSIDIDTLSATLDSYHLKLLLTLTVGFAVASIFGYLSRLVKLSPLVGYLVAGYVIGPYFPGVVADSEIADQLAEVGVVLMMFGVGLHFKLEDLFNVRRIAIPGAIIQTLVATLAVVAFLTTLGWQLEAGIVVGLCVGVASTVVLVRILSDNDLLSSQQGHVAVGWLIVEDVLTVVALLLIPTLASSVSGEGFSFPNVAKSVAWVVVKFIVLGALIFTLGRRLVVFCLVHMARMRSHELFTVTVLALTFIIATGSSLLFGTSIALGAFMAGMVIGRTDVSEQVSANSLPLRDVFVVTFFLSVGMLFNPAIIFSDFGLFIGILAAILIVKPLVAMAVVLVMKYDLRTALTVAIGLAQIGEFSFILSEEAMKYHLLPDDGYDVIVACALVSIALNPILFRLLPRMERWLGVRAEGPHPVREVLEDNSPVIQRKAIVVGFGPVGQEMTRTLEELGFSTLIIDRNIDTISRLRATGRQSLYGDASMPEILEHADIVNVSLLVITAPEVEAARNIIITSQRLNPLVRIIARTRYLSEKAIFANLDAELICGEEESILAFRRAIQRACETEDSLATATLSPA